MKKSIQAKLDGFTLIELLVVVLIIGILSAIALPQYTIAVEKSRLAEAQTNAASLQRAIDVWLLENGGYPKEHTDFTGKDANSSLFIDFEGNMDCDSQKWFCVGKNFSYIASCDTNYCQIYVERQINGSTAYNFQVEKHLSASWTGDECDYYTDVSSVGEKICKMLEAQENGYFSCKNC